MKVRKSRVKAVKILKLESPSPEEHIVVAEVHVEAPLTELPDDPLPVENIAFTPEQETSGWAKWWKSLWDLK